MAAITGPGIVTSGLVFNVDPAKTPNSAGGSSYVWYNESVPGAANMGTSASAAAFDTNIITYGVVADYGYHDGVILWSNAAPTTKWGSTISAGLPSYMPYSDALTSLSGTLHSFCWTAYGQMYFPSTGTYTFNIDGDDACDMFVNNTNVANFYGSHGFYGPAGTGGTWTAGTISIGAIGWYPFRVRMAEGNAGNGVAIGWQKPGDASVTTIPAANMRPYYVYNRVNPGFHTVIGTQAKTDNTVIEGDGSTTAISYPSPASGGFNVAGQITIEYWQYLTVTGVVPFCKGLHYVLAIQGANTYQWADSSNYSFAAFGTRTATGIGALNTWTHVTITKNASNLLSVYVNGALADSVTFGGALTTTANPLWIGGYSDSTAFPTNIVNGKIGQVRIYNTALSATEVLQNYNATKIRYGL